MSSFQIRVLPKTHRALRRLSKKTGVPVTQIVERLVKNDAAKATSTDEPTGQGRPSASPPAHN